MFLSMILYLVIIPLAMAHHSVHHAHAHAHSHAHAHAHARGYAQGNHGHGDGLPIHHELPHNPVEIPPASEGLTQVVFSEDLLYAHNKVRAEVGVGPLKWDDKLAAYAMTYASQRVGDCGVVHSHGAYGENIAESSGDMSGMDFVKMWEDEKRLYDPHSNACKGGYCLHYKQMVWKNTQSVGCAKIQCKNNGWFFVICNYNPPGNFLGEHPY